MRRFYLYWLTLAIGLLIGAILTERRHFIEAREADEKFARIVNLKEMLLETKMMRAIHPKFDEIARRNEEELNG